MQHERGVVSILNEKKRREFGIAKNEFKAHNRTSSPKCSAEWNPKLKIMQNSMDMLCKRFSLYSGWEGVARKKCFMYL